MYESNVGSRGISRWSLCVFLVIAVAGAERSDVLASISTSLPITSAFTMHVDAATFGLGGMNGADSPVDIATFVVHVEVGSSRRVTLSALSVRNEIICSHVLSDYRFPWPPMLAKRYSHYASCLLLVL